MALITDLKTWWAQKMVEFGAGMEQGKAMMKLKKEEKRQKELEKRNVQK